MKFRHFSTFILFVCGAHRLRQLFILHTIQRTRLKEYILRAAYGYGSINCMMVGYMFAQVNMDVFVCVT